MEQDVYTTGQAARILGVTDRGVRKMIDRGELEASTDDRGRHRIPQREVHRLLQERREAAKASGSSSGAPQDSTVAQETAELRAKVEDLQRQLGRLEGRLELTAQAESTVREQLERERELADGERGGLDKVLQEERAERRALQEELDRVREEAAQAQARPWWRRIFG